MKIEQNSFNKQTLFFFIQTLFLLVILSLTACNQAEDKINKAQPPESKATSSTALIYRPKLKLALKDPNVFEQYKQAVLFLIPPKQKATAEDYQKARALFLPLAEAGYVDAMYGMAASYFPHLASAPDYLPSNSEKGIPWLTRAADAGHASAQYSLAIWYFRGWRSYTPLEHMNSYSDDRWRKINHYYTAAAEQGHAYAVSGLALYRERANDEYRLYEYDEFMARAPERSIESYMWYTLSMQHWDQKKQNEREAKGLINEYALDLSLRNQLIISGKMTDEQVAEGERRAKQWIKQHPDAYTSAYAPFELSFEEQARKFTRDDNKKKSEVVSGQTD